MQINSEALKLVGVRIVLHIGSNVSFKGATAHGITTSRVYICHQLDSDCHTVQRIRYYDNKFLGSGNRNVSVDTLRLNHGSVF
jgi:hypothetical protein